MNSIEDIFKKYNLSNMNDEDTREKLAKNHDIRIKIAEEIIEKLYGEILNRFKELLRLVS
jgi:hypothetical protein